MMATASAGLKSHQHHLQQKQVARVVPLNKAGSYRHQLPQQRLLLRSGSCSGGCLNGSCGHTTTSTCGHTTTTACAQHQLGEMFSFTPTTAGMMHPSSSSSSATHYPKETANPPPTPITRQQNLCYKNCYQPLGLAAPARGPHIHYPPHASGTTFPPHYPEDPSSPAPGHFVPLATDHSYRHYKTRNRPPPPTPCSTDICDDSDMNSTTLITSTPSYSSDTNEPQQHDRHKERRKPPRDHHHPNSPTTQYCSFASLPQSDFYADSDPEPPPPTPQLVTERSGSPSFVVNQRTGEDTLDRDQEGEQIGLLLGGNAAAAAASVPRNDRYYRPPPPSPVPSD